MPLKKQPKKEASLRAFLKKEMAKGKNKVKHPDALIPNKAGHLPLTQSNLSAFERSPALAKVNPGFRSPTHGRPGYGMGSSSANPTYEVGFSLLDHGHSRPSPAKEPPTVASPIHYSDVNSLFEGRVRGDANSIFGDPLPSVREQKLEQLLAEGTPKIPTVIFSESDNLRDLKDELKQLALSETDKDLTDREWNLIQRLKGPLRGEVRYMEEVEIKAFEENRTGKLQGELPEPIGHFEKKRLAQFKRRIERAKAGEERTNKRSRREEHDNDHDLDGEERLRLGKSVKPKPLPMTGHFWTTRIVEED